MCAGGSSIHVYECTVWMWADPGLSGLHGVEPTLVPYLWAHRGAKLHKQAHGLSLHSWTKALLGDLCCAAEMEVLMRA